MSFSAGHTGRCIWCGAEIDAADSAGERRVRCRTCGAETTFPYPSAAELDDAYASWYRPGGGRFRGPGDRLLRRSRGHLARRIDRIAPEGRVLDIGAGDGALVTALRECGREAAGTERGLDEVDGDGPAPESTGRWSAIVFWHSLEHLPDPGAQVASLTDRLAPGGVAIIAMPNRASLQSRLFGDRWLHLDLPRHLSHVPAPCLLRTLEEEGLEVERVSYLRGGQVVFGWLHGLVASLPGSPDLYDAIRRPRARSRPQSAAVRAGALTAGIVLLPVALALSAVEALARRGGAVYVEARSV